MAAGWRGLIALSDDEGRSWRQAEVPVREDLTALSFPTPAHGWAVGNEGVLLETTDGGAHWAKRLDGIKLAAPADELRYEPSYALHGLESLPLTFSARASA